MIEPEYRDMVGVSQSFAPADDAAVEQAADLLRTAGIGHVRVPVDYREIAGAAGQEAWLGLLAKLAAVCTVLPSLTLSEPGTCDALFARLSGLCESIELAGPVAALDGLVPLASKAGLKICLRATDTAHIAQFEQAGLLDAADAVGVPADMAEAVELPAGLELWITDASYPTWKHDEHRQAQALLDAIQAQPARLYWTALIDRPRSVAATQTEAHAGLFDQAGQPKLAARLLSANGIAGLDRTLTLARRLHMPAIVGTRAVLITGGAGFIGANLADRLAGDGHHVMLFDALARTGVERNLLWLAKRHPTRISFALGDIRDEAAVGEAAAKAESVFHLAGQVAVTTSMVHPVSDFGINAAGTLALLEALRLHNPTAPLVFASTNKVYGDLADIALTLDGERYLPVDPALRASGIGEDRALCFHTPYGCSKGTADQYVLDYAHSFGLRTAVLRMSCIYGERQLGTEDQGWVAHFLLRAIAGDGLTIYGDGHQVRDVLHVSDAVAAYTGALAEIDSIAGRAFNLGGGPANAISLVQLVAYLEQLLGRSIPVDFSPWRPGDQRYFVADTSEIRRTLNLQNPLGWQAGIARLAEHFGVTGRLQAAEAVQ